MNPSISIVIPLYNEESIFPLLIERLTGLISNADVGIEILMVDDGSSDSTASLMRAQCTRDNRFSGIFLSRNFGHQLAVSAGLKYARGTECIFIIDGDLQDPPELLWEFKKKLDEGYEVVYGIRKKRKENFIKRSMYWIFYRLIVRLSEIKLPLDSGDFCLISRRVCNMINKMPEQSRYIRGMRSWVGFKQTGLEYERQNRQAGEPKYNFKMLFKLAYDGIFNFSNTPLKAITSLGLFTVFVSLLYILILAWQWFMGQPIPSGFTTLIIAIILFSGVQMVCLGIIGEYLSRIFLQVKERPLFVVSSVIQDSKEDLVDG